MCVSVSTIFSGGLMGGHGLATPIKNANVHLLRTGNVLRFTELLEGIGNGSPRLLGSCTL